jgi:hypothetical protein
MLTDPGLTVKAEIVGPETVSLATEVAAMPTASVTVTVMLNTPVTIGLHNNDATLDEEQPDGRPEYAYP